MAGIESALAIGVPLVTSLLSGLFGSQTADKKYSQDRQLMQEQNQFNAEQAGINREFLSSEAEISRQWNREQELDARLYNSPSAQMMRNRLAGLNPYLTEGAALGSAASGAQATGGSQASASGLPESHPYNIGEDVRAGFNNYVALAQVNAETSLKNQQTELLKQQGINQEIVNQFTASKEIMSLYQMRSQLENSNMDTSLKNIQIREIDRNIALLNRQFEGLAEKPYKENDLLSAQSDYYVAAELLQKSNIRVNEKKIDEIAQSIRESRNRVAQGLQAIEESKERVRASEKNREKMEHDIKVLDAQKDDLIASAAKKLAEKYGLDANNKFVIERIKKELRLTESEIQKNYQQKIGILGSGIDYTNPEYYTHGGEWND